MAFDTFKQNKHNQKCAWSHAELTYLMGNSNKFTLDELSKRMNRPINQIRAKCQKQGFSTRTV